MIFPDSANKTLTNDSTNIPNFKENKILIFYFSLFIKFGPRACNVKLDYLTLYGPIST